MPRISTIYDKIVNEEDGIKYSRKVFMVRGDEAYAKATGVDLSIGTITEGETDYTVPITVTVHRGTGSSVCYVYDNDELLGQFDTTALNTHTFTFDFPYDIEHNLKAVYKGNGECFGSKSRVEKLYRETPVAYETIVDMSGTDTYIHTDATSYDIGISLSINGETSSTALHNKPVYVTYPTSNGYTTEIFYTGADNNYINETIQIDGEMEDGLYTISATVPRSEGLNPSEDSIEVSKGCIITLTNYPQTTTSDEQHMIMPTVVDYMGNQLYDVTVMFGHDDEWVRIYENNVYYGVRLTTTGTYYAKCNGSMSEGIQIIVIELPSVDMKVIGGLDVYGETMSFQIYTNVDNVPLNLTGAITGTYNTDSDGKISVDYTCDGGGDKSFDVNYNTYRMDTITFTDHHSMWNRTYSSRGNGGIINPPSNYIRNGTVEYFPNYYQVKFLNAHEIGGTLLNFVDITDGNYFELEMDVIEWTIPQNFHAILGGTIILPQLSSPNGKLKWVWDDSSIKIYWNDALLKETSSRLGSMNITSLSQSSVNTGNMVLKFNNVKIKRL